MRDADVLGVWSPNKKNAASAAAARSRSLDVGNGRNRTRSIADMVADPAIDAIWLTRAESRARRERRGDRRRDRARQEARSRGIACEKPLARNVAEAKRVTRAREARRDCTHGYLENQVVRAAGRNRAALALGARRGARPAVRTSRARPRSTAVRTCRGSGAATCRAAAC